MKLGFIGAGNMASAIMGGILASGLLAKEEILASDASDAALEKAKTSFGISVTKDNKEAACCETVILAVKPQYYSAVIEEIAPVVTKDTLIITIAPGQTLKSLEDRFGPERKLVRTMPNTPALVLEGMTAVCKNQFVTEEELNYACSLFNSFGKSTVVPENLMDAVVGVSGSSPAYVFLFIEALADAAVMGGMPRPMAYEFAAQAVLGSAKMVLETGLHPGALKDMVCSPAGTTIEAVRVLEEKGFRSAVIEATAACINKAKNI